ncbi:MAG: prepilin-type N-terminal cleavage/methylation domain-containing protein [Candidatus Omnitrophota bacterium]
MRIFSFKKNAFTLVEIMIVVAIIVLLSGIAIPNLLRARLHANEASAIATLKAVRAAAEMYRIAHSPDYPKYFTYFFNDTPPYLDDSLQDMNKSGYSFRWRGLLARYDCIAIPQVENVTGQRSFYLDESGVIRIGQTVLGTPIE